MDLQKHQYEQQEAIPLSALFTETDQATGIKIIDKNKVNQFVQRCEQLYLDNLSVDQVITQVVACAIDVEFATEQQHHGEMVRVISEAISAEPMLKEEVLSFAKCHLKQLKINPTLIN